jgi:hypothetical protein
MTNTRFLNSQHQDLTLSKELTLRKLNNNITSGITLKDVNIPNQSTNLQVNIDPDQIPTNNIVYFNPIMDPYDTTLLLIDEINTGNITQESNYIRANLPAVNDKCVIYSNALNFQNHLPIEMYFSIFERRDAYIDAYIGLGDGLDSTLPANGVFVCFPSELDMKLCIIKNSVITEILDTNFYYSKFTGEPRVWNTFKIEILLGQNPIINFYKLHENGNFKLGYQYTNVTGFDGPDFSSSYSSWRFFSSAERITAVNTNWFDLGNLLIQQKYNGLDKINSIGNKGIKSIQESISVINSNERPHNYITYFNPKLDPYNTEQLQNTVINNATVSQSFNDIRLNTSDLNDQVIMYSNTLNFINFIPIICYFCINRSYASQQTILIGLGDKQTIDLPSNGAFLNFTDDGLFEINIYSNTTVTVIDSTMFYNSNFSPVTNVYETYKIVMYPCQNLLINFYKLLNDEFILGYSYYNNNAQSNAIFYSPINEFRFYCHNLRSIVGSAKYFTIGTILIYQKYDNQNDILLNNIDNEIKKINKTNIVHENILTKNLDVLYKSVYNGNNEYKSNQDSMHFEDFSHNLLDSQDHFYNKYGLNYILKNQNEYAEKILRINFPQGVTYYRYNISTADLALTNSNILYQLALRDFQFENSYMEISLNLHENITSCFINITDNRFDVNDLPITKNIEQNEFNIDQLTDFNFKLQNYQFIIETDQHYFKFYYKNAFGMFIPFHIINSNEHDVTLGLLSRPLLAYFKITRLDSVVGDLNALFHGFTVYKNKFNLLQYPRQYNTSFEQNSVLTLTSAVESYIFSLKYHEAFGPTENVGIVCNLNEISFNNSKICKLRIYYSKYVVNDILITTPQYTEVRNILYDINGTLVTNNADLIYSKICDLNESIDLSFIDYKYFSRGFANSDYDSCLIFTLENLESSDANSVFSVNLYGI